MEEDDTQHQHPLVLPPPPPEEEEEQEIFLVDEDLEENSLFEKTVTFEIQREYSLVEDGKEDHCMQVVRPWIACAMVGTVVLFAAAYGIIVLMDTKLSTPLDMLLAFVCAMSGLICFCVMRHCSLRARRKGIRRKKRRHSIKMHRIGPSDHPTIINKPDASLDSLSRLIQKNGT